jgi:deoxyinosine 3'endonuclease (endonuclease V)
MASSDEIDAELLQKWSLEQVEMKTASALVAPVHLVAQELRFVAGTDISFVKGSDVSVSCIAVTTGPPGNTLVWSQTRVCSILTPYIPGFLAFREVGPLLEIADALRAECDTAGASSVGGLPGVDGTAPCTVPVHSHGPSTAAACTNATQPSGGSWPVVTWRHPDIAVAWPDVFLVDGNGALHPRAFGLACHLGLLLASPTIGIGKNLMSVDGLGRQRLAELVAAEHGSGGMRTQGDCTMLVADSGVTHGAAVILGVKATNPTYVSVGHAVGLPNAIQVAVAASIHRVPEAIRQADHIGRERIRAGLESISGQVNGQMLQM